MSNYILIGNDKITAYVKPVENFLKRLYFRSRKDPKAVFTGLYKELKWPKLLTYAALRILGNQGAYTEGIDNVTKGLFLRTFEQQIKDIQAEIKEGIDPLAVRRAWIPKPGKTEKRPLGIPALRDKVIQEAIRLILEAIYEPTFKRNSVGFRCGFSTQDALKDCWAYMQPKKKMQYVLEFDIRKFFDNVDHEILFNILGEKIHDRKLRIAIWKIMKAEIYEEGIYSPNHKGVPQGGVISPILANIYLDKFDDYMIQLADSYSVNSIKTRKRKDGTTYKVIEKTREIGLKRMRAMGISKSGTLGYVRYADDGVAFWNGPLSELYKIKELCKTFLRERLKLELSEEKTVITDVEKGFKFVGFYFIRKRTSKSQKGLGEYVKYPLALAPKQSIHRIKKEITKICRISSIKGYDQSYTILKLNQIIDGCYNYFKNTSYPSNVYISIFGHAKCQFWYYLKRRGFKYKEAKKLFWKSIGSYKTWTYKKYAIRVPPESGKRTIKTINQKRLDVTHTDRYMSRKQPSKISRMYPNDPIVPMDGSWRILRNKILDRDKGKCVFCGKPATQVDHIFTKAECKCNIKLSKVRDKSQFLRSVCERCHIQRHGGKWSWSVVMDMIDSINSRSNGTGKATSEVNGNSH